MKKITPILMLILFASFLSAQNNYDDQWKTVTKQEKAGLTKSALQTVEAIYSVAKKENNKPQLIKTLLYKSKYVLILEEDAQLKIINDFKVEINNTKAPLKNVLENMLATLYWQYFQSNRWQFYNRTSVNNPEDVLSDDFRTWDLQTLFDEIQQLYSKSLENGLELQQTKLDDFDAIIHKQEGSRTYRPTLFDLLSHNALSFYKTDENAITKPAYKFEIDNPNYLSDAHTFSNLTIDSKDKSSLQLQALKVYQKLIKFHLSRKDKEALVEVDIERLNYVYNNAKFQDKQERFISTLKASGNNYNETLSGLYNYEIAKIYQEQGNAYNAKTNTDNQWKLKDAVELCDKVINKSPNSRAAKKCKALKSQIAHHEINLRSESTLPINKESLLLVNYKNINTVNFDICKVSLDEIKRYNKTYRPDEKRKFVNKLKVMKSFSSTLKNEGDFQNHSTELVLPKLENGHYFIIAKLPNDDKAFAVQQIQVTDMALLEKSTNNEIVYQIINRNNGEPLANVSATLKYRTNYQGSFKSINLKSNDKGEIRTTKKDKRYNDVSIALTRGNETAHFGDFYLNGYYKPHKQKATNQAFVFSDRSIYRPGQTVYFKSIIIERDNNNSRILSDYKVEATLRNVNGEELQKLNLVTNEYGSIKGEFILPNGGLTGNYYIDLRGQNLYGNHYFSVEEYKRPKFETTFKPVTETFKINETITVNGTAQAYAGSNITEAKVVYRVQRKVRYPRWWFWYRPWFSSESQEIAHDETTTNDKGEFTINFKALPDLSVNKDDQPIFNYEITADVTDINGETRSATTVVNVGYHALEAFITAPDKIDKSDADIKIEIDTKNLNGEFVAAKGELKIYKLKAPNRVLRKRPWEAPDYKALSKEEFVKLFPHEAYDNENNSINWEKGELVFSESFDTGKSKAIELKKIKKWESGQYIIVLDTKDRFGQAVKAEARTTVFNKSDKTVADNQILSITTNQEQYKPNETVDLCIASAAKDIYVTVAIEKHQEIVDSYIFRLNNSTESISIPVNNDDLGGFAVHYSFSAYNSFHSGTEAIAVPYPETDLKIETETFRDKLQPGTEETWKFKIKGPKGEKVSAELLASMYDMSLDQFMPHQWQFQPNFKNNYYSTIHINSANSFGVRHFRVEDIKRNVVSFPHLQFDELNWFGLNLGNQNFLRRQYRRSQVESKLTSSYDSSIKSGIIKGVVSSAGDGLPLPGANVIIKGTTNGTQTDFDGNFKIEAKKGDVLVFSYVGFKTIEHKISKDNYLYVSLGEDAFLEEVVVTGYRATLKSSQKLAEPEMMMDAEEAVAGSASDKDDKWRVRNSAGDYKKSDSASKPKKTDFDQVKIRTNLKETAFFFPQLHTDKEGNVSFSFTTPEALTKWKLQLLAHTKELESSVKTLETVTQKELMVIPNAPRFLREGDVINISTKIANITDKELSGIAQLILTDPITEKDISEKLISASPMVKLDGVLFTVDAKGNTQVNWTLKIPKTIQAVQYKVIAKAGDFSDGEQNALPVLSNRMLVTETLPMWVRSNQTKTFTLDKLKNTTSTTFSHHKLTLEMTSNPAWYAVQALPYLMEYPYECNEQTFSRYYANVLASHIANSNPRIQEVFNQWKNTDALLSNLEKNQELKSILIQETPWLRDAQSETEQKKRIALLFDLNKMNNELQGALRKLQQNQMGNGAWSWFNGGRANRYITQHIITGFGHLKKLNVKTDHTANTMVQRAISYLDAQFVKEYKDIRKYNAKVDLEKDHLSYAQLHYLYMRSFFPEIKKSAEVQRITDYYHSQIKKYWLKRPLYAKGLMTLVAHRLDDNALANGILRSLKENSITSDELGMYWKENTNSWYWYQAPIETQALLIEAFSEVENNIETIDNLKIWLLKNKQTNRWKTTKATTDAVYALLLQGSDWLSVTDMVDIVLGGENIEPQKLEATKVEAGTGYFKTAWNTTEIQPKMAEVTISKKGKGIAWGSLYWQYFEDLDKITSAETPLKLNKRLFLKTNSDTGEKITEITDKTKLKVGDLVRVRIELRSDRAMEFVHMKDMRAAGFEPVNVLSQYKWQDGLGYYESTKDAATNFFFDYLPKGVYVFEYDLRVNNAGDMSNGITTIQSMYAPEFSSHSEGIRVRVE